MIDATPVSFGLAFVAGLVSFLSPCVLPLVPSYVTFVTGMTLDELGSGERRAARASAALHGTSRARGDSAGGCAQSRSRRVL